MISKSFWMTESFDAYMAANWLREPELLRRLREETHRLPHGGMQISPEQGQFMAMLVKLMGARECLEVGVFTGYSSLSVALALPPEGRIVACDVSKEFTDVARRYWQEAGVADRIDLRLGPASETLQTLIDAGRVFDFAFIDADKTGYPDYYEKTLRLLRPGGLMLLDNVFQDGRAADPAATGADTRTVRELNAKIAQDDRVDLALSPIGDGMTMARKR